MEGPGQDENELVLLMRQVGAIPKGTKRSLFRRRGKWKQVASTWLMRIITKGTNLFMGRVPPRVRIIHHSPTQQHALEQWITAALQQGFIEEGKTKVINPIFAIPKPNGTNFRIILDLRHPNSYCKVPKFRLDRIEEAAKVAPANGFATIIDLMDAYHQVPVAENTRQALGFSVGGRTYRYAVLPQGSNASPYIYVKTIMTTIREIRKRGVRIVSYMDDFIIMAKDKKTCIRHTKLTLKILSDFGWIVNWAKSQLVPSRTVTFLGFDLTMPKYSSPMMISIPAAKRHSISHDLQRLARRTISAKLVAQTIGRALSLRAALPDAMVLCRTTQILLAKTVAEQGWWSHVVLTSQCKEDLLQLARAVKDSEPRRLAPPIQITIRSDASLSGSGAVLMKNGEVLAATHATWKQEQHINVLELISAWKALKCFRNHIKNKVVMLETDNTVALSYLRKGTGRTRNLRRIANRIFWYCKENNIYLYSRHIQGIKNVLADHLSRRSTVGLHPAVEKNLGITLTSFPIPKTIPIAEEISVMTRLRGAIITPRWPGATWIPLLQQAAKRRINLDEEETTLSPDSILGRQGLLLWDFSLRPLKGTWKSATEPFY